jgi:hypothetical protein
MSVILFKKDIRMEQITLGGAQEKIQEYVSRLKAGESRDSLMQGLPPSFVAGIEAAMHESEDTPEAPTEKTEIIPSENDIAIPLQYKNLNADALEIIWTIPEYIDSEKTATERKRKGDAIAMLREKEALAAEEAERREVKEKRIEELRRKIEAHRGPPINYIEVVIDDAFMKKNLVPGKGLRMYGGHANWNGEVDLMKYVMSDDLSPEYRAIAEDRIEKSKAGWEKFYQHESHHIKNRENGLTPHVAAENLREFLAFRVLDELSAFTTGELYNQDITPEHILTALRNAKQSIEDLYYGEPFNSDAQWYASRQGGAVETATRYIDQEKYHQIMRQYFTIGGKNVLDILRKSGTLPEFTEIVNTLILELDTILDTINFKN